LAVSSAVRHDFFIFASGLFMALAGRPNFHNRPLVSGKHGMDFCHGSQRDVC
jgi:hypothetical protein